MKNFTSEFFLMYNISKFDGLKLTEAKGGVISYEDKD